MKRTLLILSMFFCAVLCAPTSTFAQAVPSPTPSGVDAAFTRLFGECKAFTADATVQVYDKAEQEVVSSSMEFSVSDSRVRMDMDMSKLKSKDLPAGATASLKQVGMDKVVSLILPERKSSYVIYPGLKSILKVPMKETELKSATADYKLERIAVGKETLDGHPCIKYKVTVTDASGAKQEAVTWNAADLKDFPVQVQISDGENLMIMRLRKVKLIVPSPTLFVLPSDYTQYNNQQDLMQAVMMKVLSGLQGLQGE